MSLPPLHPQAARGSLGWWWTLASAAPGGVEARVWSITWWVAWSAVWWWAVALLGVVKSTVVSWAKVLATLVWWHVRLTRTLWLACKASLWARLTLLTAIIAVWLVTWALLELLRTVIGDWAWNTLWRTVDVELLIDLLWNWLNLSAQFLLNVVKVEAIIPVNQVNSQAEMSKTTRATNAMQVSLGILWEVKVDDNVDCLNIDTASEQVGANKVAADTVTEVVEDSVTSCLKHASVTVEARVAEFGDLLGEKLNAVGRVAEDDRLVDLQLGEEGV